MHVKEEAFVQHAETVAGPNKLCKIRSRKDTTGEFRTTGAARTATCMGRQLCQLLGSVGGHASFSPEFLDSNYYRGVLDLVTSCASRGFCRQMEKEGWVGNK